MGEMVVVSVGRRPLASGTVASNVLKHGTGALNINAARLQHASTEDLAMSLAKNPGRPDLVSSDVYGKGRPQQSVNTAGRWPSNLILQHLPGCTQAGTTRVPGHKGYPNGPGGKSYHYSSDKHSSDVRPSAWTSPSTNVDGTETVAVWVCQQGCPVVDLDSQSGESKSSGGRAYQNTNDMYSGGWSHKGTGVPIDPGFGDVGGASRYFKQIEGASMETVGTSEVPQDLLDYLHTLITPTHVGGETLIALDINAVDWAAIPDGKYHGLIARGEPTEEQTEHLWRVIKPGAHVLLIAPDTCPTGHRGACSLEDRGFEIRDAILWVREAGKLHYVPKANSRERNDGCNKLAAKRKGAPVYELRESVLEDEDVLSELQEALLEAGVAAELVDTLEENGLPKDKIPKGFLSDFKPREGGGKYGNHHPCLHPDALVMTESGFRPIREVRVGSRVYTQDGSFHPVEHVSQHPYTSEHLYEIGVTGTNYTSLVSDNHPFLVWRVSRSRKGGIQQGHVCWLQASELQKGDYTLTPVLTRPRKVTDYMTVEYWFIFGLWVAEGVLQRAGHGENGYPSFSLHVDEMPLIDRIRSFFGADKVSVYPKGTSKGVQVMAFVPEIGAQFKHFGGSGAASKTLHPDIWLLPEEAQRAILDGYMAGDGGRVRKHLQAKTVSPDLASQFTLLGEALGYKANLYRFEPDFGKGIQGRKFKNVQPSYQIHLHETNQALTTRKPSKPGFIEHEGVKYSLRYIKSIRHVPYSGDVWNLSVEGSPTFQTAVGMSHNTVKPKMVMQRLLADIPKDKVVLDPFMGSGSTALACWETRHSFIGIEREAEYIEVADARVRFCFGSAGDAPELISEAPPPDNTPVKLHGGVFDMFGGD